MKKRVWIPSAIFLVLLITYFMGPLPPNPDYSPEWPEVPSSLTALEKYIQQREDSLPVRKDNQARILWYYDEPQVTEYSFVYLHGFAGSYRDGYPVNVQVADTFGANIYLDRWAGHGLNDSAAMKNFSPERAWQSAKEALAIGHQIGRKVIIMSTSTGGTLAIRLAATYPDSVHALINMSPNIWDDNPAAFLLNIPWGYEIAHLAALGKDREIEYEQDSAALYWDNIYPAEALVDLQVLVSSTMHQKTYQDVTCPVLTLFYYENFLEEDNHVEVEEYPEVHEGFSTPDSLLTLKKLEEPETHFIGSAIMSKNYQVVRAAIIEFCRQKLHMEFAADAED